MSSAKAQDVPAAQDVDPARGTAEWHHQRATTRLVTGTIFTAGGITLVAVGAEKATSNLSLQGGGRIETKGAGLVVLGAALTAVGVPILISSFVNRAQYRMKLKKERAWLPQRGEWTQFPALSFSITIGR